MTVTATHILEEYRQLTPEEQREVLRVMTQESAVPPAPTGKPRKTIADVAGKYCSSPETAGEDHNEGFVKAIMETKGRRWS